MHFPFWYHADDCGVYTVLLISVKHTKEFTIRPMKFMESDPFNKPADMDALDEEVDEGSSTGAVIVNLGIGIVLD